MKKILFALALLVSCVTGVYAATPAEESAERIAKLEKLLTSVPGNTGVSEIDNYVNKTKEAATLAVKNSVSFKAAIDGELAVLVTLVPDVKKEGEDVADATKISADAAKALKGINPMKAGKAKKALDFANKALQIVTEESVYQAQAVAELAK